MLSKITISLFFLGVFSNFGVLGQKDTPTANYTSVRSDDCKIYIKQIKFTRIDGDGKDAKPNYIFINGEHLNETNSTADDPQCGNHTDTGIIYLEYSNIDNPGKAEYSLDYFALTWEIEYKKRIGWWDVSSLNLTAKGKMTGDELISVNWTGAVMQSVEMGASFNFSYACSRPTKLLYNPSPETTGPGKVVYSLEFQNIQLQPFDWKAPPRLAKKGIGFTENVDDCVAFFGADTWMALIPVFIFVFVILFGVVMLSNMPTVNRFDDPKSKPLVITAKE